MGNKAITIQDIAELCGSGRFCARLRGGEIIMEDKQTGEWIILTRVQQSAPPQAGTKPKAHGSRVANIFGENWKKHPGGQGKEEFTGNQGPYKGFLMVKCEECGKVKGFCAKRETYSYRCDACGGVTPLENLRPLFMKCKCGKEYKYKTNLTEELFTYDCVNCQAPVDMELNKRGTAYVTINERG